jgi:hypothetical protein
MLDIIRTKAFHPPNTITTAPTLSRYACTSQLERAEKDLLDAVQKLRERKRVHGEPLSLDEMLDPVDERQIGKSEFDFPGGDDKIVSVATAAAAAGSHFLSVDVKMDDDIDDDEDDKPDEAGPAALSPCDIVEMCKRLEKACIEHADARGIDALQLQQSLCRFRGHAQRLICSMQKQSTLDSFFQVS